MNREIIFRGKRVNGGEWVNSMTISHGTIKRKTYAVFFEIQPEKWVGVIPETVGQFTGITTSGDGNPERIYEHDIVGFVDIDQHVVAEVIFENGSFCFRDKEGQVYYPCDVQCVSVLGNKFDNPGLIKELKGE